MFYKINGVQMPPFVSFESEDNNLYGENTGRDEAGYNHLDLIRAGVRKWNVKHHMITKGELNQIKQACGALSFSFNGFSSAGYVTATCYATISGQQCLMYKDDSDTGSYWACDVAIVEM